MALTHQYPNPLNFPRSRQHLPGVDGERSTWGERIRLLAAAGAWPRLAAYPIPTLTTPHHTARIFRDRQQLLWHHDAFIRVLRAFVALGCITWVSARRPTTHTALFPTFSLRSTHILNQVKDVYDDPVKATDVLAAYDANREATLYFDSQSHPCPLPMPQPNPQAGTQ